MRINPQLIKGVTNMLILASLKNTHMYGYKLIQQIKLRTNKHIHYYPGSIYPALKKLLKNKYITASTAKVNGRLRKNYMITKRGLNYLMDLEDMWNIYISIITQIIK